MITSCDTESLNPQVPQEPKNSDQSTDSGKLTLVVAIVAGSGHVSLLVHS